MIIDKLDNIRNYEGVFCKFKKVFDYILSINLQNLPEGKHPMPEDLGYIGIDKAMARQKGGAYPEAHRKYIDIQIPFSNIDIMGWKGVSDCKKIKIPYDVERDMIFFDEEPDFYIPVRPGQFIIFFPQDAHSPLIGKGIIHKSIIKVRI